MKPRKYVFAKTFQKSFLYALQTSNGLLGDDDDDDDDDDDNDDDNDLDLDDDIDISDIDETTPLHAGELSTRV